MHDEMREPTEEELRAAFEEQMRSVRVEDVILQTVATLVNMGAQRLGLTGEAGGERDLGQVQLAIEGARALVPLLEQFGLASAAELDPETWADRLRAEVETGGVPATVGVSVCAWARKA
jgi:hypothetical protein